MPDPQEESVAIVDPVVSNLKRWSDHVSFQLVIKSRWAWKANCYELSPKAMYPPTEAGQIAVAADVCGDCPVKRQCLMLSLMSRETYGVWGATTESERGELLKMIDEVFDPKEFTDSSCLKPISDVVDSWLDYQSMMSDANYELVRVKEI